MVTYKRLFQRILFIFGTRPEAIKLAPLIRHLRDYADVVVCVTAQHREMLDQVMDFFSISADYDLDIMSENQSLFAITAGAITGLDGVIEECRPDLIIIQGDTTTALAGAIAGFYKKISIAHIEAGLRSHDKYSPFPEEMNRALVGRLADYHFAPTERAVEHLSQEGIRKNVFMVGNTVIDALLLALDLVRRNEAPYVKRFSFLDRSKRMILVTGHRRESFGAPFGNICEALAEIALTEAVEIVYPVHLNPNVRDLVYPRLNGVRGIHLIDPLDYPSLVWLMNRSYMILTDSGGIQEEAPSLGKPVIVLRDVTERTEGIEAGNAVLTGTDRDKILSCTRLLLNNQDVYTKMAKTANPYGDGQACERIRSILGFEATADERS